MTQKEMTKDLKPIKDYIHSIGKALTVGDATEHTHRPALKTLLENLDSAVTATNEPKHIECGAPDLILRKGSVTIGYIEAKDIGKSLDEAEKTDQLKRYRDSLTNLVLTDYLEFHWYVDGECRLKARLGSPTKDGKIKRDKDGVQAVAELLVNFLSHKAEGVGTPKELARRMARQAHLIRNLIINAFQNEPESSSLHTQLVAFRANLIPDLSVEYFADMYAQTIAYGLFAARCISKNGASFTRLDAVQNLPKTNPFLRKLFQYIAGYDLDDRIAWLVDDLAQVLAQADMDAVLKDFGKHSGKEDPVVHFYETFLKEYDEKIRDMRGVYYTPEPVVSYIVRSIDHLLKTRFNKTQGLADDKTLILDPAVGTATFLYMVVNEIYQAIVGKGQQGLWNNYVAEKLLPRIFGFELLMAPYAVAHLKLGLLLQETGYEFHSDQRLGIYLTNTLDEAIKHSETLFARWISEEANAAAKVKKDEPIMVMIGNPPYSGHSANKGEWARQLVERYKTIDGKPLDEKNLKWLQDDYVKFLAFSQWRIERTGQGILGFITNHSYLDNPTFRGMRQSLMNTFTDIYILNLHGNAKKKEVAPDGGKDENVFDIQQGVAICLLVKELGETEPSGVHYADLWGLREDKYHILIEDNIIETKWIELKPGSPFYFFVPIREDLLADYERGWKLSDIFPTNCVGLFTARDGLTIRWSAKEVQNTIHDFVKLPPDEARDKYNLGEDVRDWRVSLAQKDLEDSGLSPELIVPILYRPFDVRYTYYTGHSRGFHCMPRPDVMPNIIKRDNLTLCIGRAGQVVGPTQWDIIYCSRQIVDLNIFYRGGGQCFPLYLYPAEGEMQFDGGKRRPNLNPEFIKAASGKLGLPFIEDDRGDLVQTFGPEDIFNYAYAVFHSPTYRTRYAEFLKIDFPRLPLTSDKGLFKSLAAKGAELAALHLMESPALNNLFTEYPVAGSNEVEKVSYDENSQRVYINKTQYFEGVSLEVWDFHIGGYQVCQKWLKDRKVRKLNYDELIHYQKVIVALKETIRLMAEIDELISEWPIG
ncbi:MAG: N-6 DNA methylase [Dehalococcoidales bacterium]|nr:N-6 DNA methylase [Dehalococcoidales bacterium]